MLLNAKKSTRQTISNFCEKISKLNGVLNEIKRQNTTRIPINMNSVQNLNSSFGTVAPPIENYHKRTEWKWWWHTECACMSVPTCACVSACACETAYREDRMSNSHFVKLIRFKAASFGCLVPWNFTHQIAFVVDLFFAVTKNCALFE